MTKIAESSEINVGSTWNKWDLHIHSPYTNMNGYACSDEKFIQKIQDENLACVGLTNYFNFKDEEYALKERLEKLGINVLMNLELRLDYQNNNQSGNENLDLHILFSETITKTEIEKLLNSIECNIKGSYKRLIDLSSEEDFKFAVVNFDKLFECLKSESLNLQGKYLIGFLSRGKGNSRSSSNFEKIANKVHFLIHSTDNQDNIDKDIKFWQQYDKPVLQSSDAHNLEAIGNKFSWIKARPSFEGLKQVIYETERVYIGKESPLSPIYRLEKVQLNFDDNAMWNNEQKFCFVDFNEPLYFSPYFTCIIGGRGSGKSTLLNLIANKIDKLDDENKRKLPTDSKAKIILKPNAIDNIEFLAQNEIEEFATNSAKFTQAIFERLDKNSEMKLHKQEQEIGERIKVFDEQIKLLLQRNSLHKKLKVKKRELERQNNIIQTFNDKTYLTNKGKLQEIGKKLLELNSSKERLKTLFNSLKEINTTHSTIDEPQNMYDKVLNESLSKIENLIQTIKNADYQKEKDEIATLEKDKKEIEEQIYKYLQDKGLSENNIQDLKNVGEIIEVIENDINNMKLEIKCIKQKIIDFKIDEIDKIIKVFNQLVKIELDKINELFKVVASDHQKDIKTIKIEYSQNDVFEIICNEFIEFLKQSFQIDIREKVTFKTYMKELELNNPNLTFKDIQNKVNSFTRISETSKILKEIFNNKLLFRIYHLLVLKNIRDIKNAKNFNVYYDEKILFNTSFGQRCTAVIVILLALGNNPIIMDEPEAHLDSSLIANYLVELIKKQKKDRQIIFATHNANFVINADAELIIKLSNDDNKILAQSFSIEDSQYREDLLKLEGRKQAFKKRERKYEI